MILAGDIGATKTILALFELRDGQLCEVTSRRFASAEYPGVAPMVTEFLAGESHRVRRAGFGIAAPVVRGRGATVNLSWVVDVRELEETLAIRPVFLVNDLVATAAGLLDLPAKDIRVLFAGEPHERGTRAVLAPGTGLGQAFLVWDGREYHPLPSEGGHADFAPRTDTEIALLEYLLGKQPRVSYEHVLAGPGISRIYDFLRDTGRQAEPSWLARELEHSDDRNAAISGAGLEDKAEICAVTLDLWAGILGAEAGNLALRTLSTGGVYLGGGIVVKLAGKLAEERFVEAYLAKGRLRRLVEKIPVGVVMNDRAALLGAARIALGGS